MTMIDKQDREDRRRAQRDGVAALEATGALDDIYARIDAGDIQLDGKDGLIQQLIKAGLERGLEAELSGHVGYDKGDPEINMFPNSRNGFYPKTVATSVGDVELAVPRDRDGTFTPMLVPKGSRRLGGLDDMIISLYAGGMTVRDIEHHLVSTIGTEISRETISKITDEVLDEVMAWQQRPLEAWRFPLVVANHRVPPSSHDLGWGAVVQAESRAVVEFGGDLVEVLLGPAVEVGALREVLT